MWLDKREKLFETTLITGMRKAAKERNVSETTIRRAMKKLWCCLKSAFSTSAAG